MQSFTYEVIGLKRDEAGLVVGGKVVAEGRMVPKTDPGCTQNAPTKKQIRFKEHAAIVTAGGPDEVEVNVRPFAQT